MSYLINDRNPSEFDRRMIDAAYDVWLELLAKVPVDVVVKKGEVAWLARRVRRDARTVRDWLKLCGLWEKLPQFRTTQTRMLLDDDTSSIVNAYKDLWARNQDITEE